MAEPTGPPIPALATATTTPETASAGIMTTGEAVPDGRRDMKTHVGVDRQRGNEDLTGDREAKHGGRGMKGERNESMPHHSAKTPTRKTRPTQLYQNTRVKKARQRERGRLHNRGPQTSTNTLINTPPGGLLPNPDPRPSRQHDAGTAPLDPEPGVGPVGGREGGYILSDQQPHQKERQAGSPTQSQTPNHTQNHTSRPRLYRDTHIPIPHANDNDNPLYRRTSYWAYRHKSPPLCTPTTTTPHNFFTTYRTFGLRASAMGTPEEGYASMVQSSQQQPLLGGFPREPESMGNDGCQRGHDNGSCGCGKGGGFWKRMTTHQRTRGLRIFVASMIAGMAFGLFTGLLSWSWNTPPRHNNHGCSRDNGPIANPSAYDSELVWAPREHCLAMPSTRASPRTFDVVFDHSRPLNLTQAPPAGMGHKNNMNPMWRSGESSLHVWGDVVLRPLDGAEDKGRLVVEMVTNTPHTNIIDVAWDPDSQSLEVIVPNSVYWPREEYPNIPCAEIRITAWVPAAAALSHLIVDTIHLDVSLLPGVELDVESATVSAVVGNAVQAASHGVTLQAREIRVHAATADVKGPWPLYNLLEISTSTGEVDVVVNLAEGECSNAPTLAKLDVSSVSGKVSVVEPLIAQTAEEIHDGELAETHERIPERDYDVRISSASGDIFAAVAASSRAVVDSVSGSLDVRVYPVWSIQEGENDDEGSPLRLSTSSKSGDVAVKVFEPMFVGEVVGLVMVDVDGDCEVDDEDVVDSDNENEVKETLAELCQIMSASTTNQIIVDNIQAYLQKGQRLGLPTFGGNGHSHSGGIRKGGSSIFKDTCNDECSSPATFCLNTVPLSANGKECHPDDPITSDTDLLGVFVDIFFDDESVSLAFNFSLANAGINTDDVDVEVTIANGISECGSANDRTFVAEHPAGDGFSYGVNVVVHIAPQPLVDESASPRIMDVSVGVGIIFDDATCGAFAAPPTDFDDSVKCHDDDSIESLDDNSVESLDDDNVEDENIDIDALISLLAAPLIANLKYRPLISQHFSMSGSLSVTYPPSWSGRFTARSLTGPVSVRGDGVEIGVLDEQDCDDDAVAQMGSLVRGGKGEGGSRAVLESFSGGVDLVIGEEEE